MVLNNQSNRRRFINSPTWKLLLALILCLSVVEQTSATSGNIQPYRKDLLARLIENWHPQDCTASVIILLTIAKDGKLLQYKTFQSSGSIKCDEEVLEAAKRTNFAPLPKWYVGNQIVFKLTLDPASRLSDLASMATDSGNFVEAERLLKRVIVMRKNAVGPACPEIAESLSHLADVYTREGKYSEAERLYKQSLGIQEKTLPPEHPGRKVVLDRLATIYNIQGRYEKAERLYMDFGGSEIDMAANLSNLAELYRVEGKYAKAEPLYKRALDIDEKALGPDHLNVASLLESYSSVLRKTNRESEAELLEERAKAIRTKVR